MSYISERLLNEHLNIVKGINQLIEDSEGTPEGELYKLIVQYPEHIYSVLGSGYCTLTSINSLLDSLHHWITDDGDYCIVRKVNHRMSIAIKGLGLDKEDVVHYDYSIQAGYGRDEDESCYTTVEDMIYLFNCSIEASSFYEQNKDCIEGFDKGVGKVPYLERRNIECYKDWKVLDQKGAKYLEEKFNVRWEDDDDCE